MVEIQAFFLSKPSYRWFTQQLLIIPLCGDPWPSDRTQRSYPRQDTPRGTRPGAKIIYIQGSRQATPSTQGPRSATPSTQGPRTATPSTQGQRNPDLKTRNNRVYPGYHYTTTDCLPTINRINLIYRFLASWGFFLEKRLGGLASSWLLLDVYKWMADQCYLQHLQRELVWWTSKDMYRKIYWWNFGPRILANQWLFKSYVSSLLVIQIVIQISKD